MNLAPPAGSVIGAIKAIIKSQNHLRKNDILVKLRIRYLKKPYQAQDYAFQ